VTDRERILALLERAGSVTSGSVAAKLKVSRQAAHRKLQALAAAGDLVHSGAGRGSVWQASATAPRRFRYESVALAEDRVFTQLESEVPAMRSLDADTRAAIFYAVTEMVNNAIDHASSRTIEVLVEPRPGGLAFEVVDDGVGAFARLREGLGLASDLDAVQEVSKGKVTTDASRHTGEGIFFTSKVADRFELDANGLRFLVDNVRDDVGVATSAARSGTRVRVEVSLPVKRLLADVFAAWTTDMEFDRTRTVVRLFAIGVAFVSRSEARRLLHGLERFREVVLDFRGVESIGQGFVDEVFRVWASAHPATRLLPEGANEVVAFMLRRAGITPGLAPRPPVGVAALPSVQPPGPGARRRRTTK
jgi:anti-sigma regulatory factor (Ser/Thr protein kinase)